MIHLPPKKTFCFLDCNSVTEAFPNLYYMSTIFVFSLYYLKKRRRLEDQ